jgi:hypothetical protein
MIASSQKKKLSTTVLSDFSRDVAQPLLDSEEISELDF